MKRTILIASVLTTVLVTSSGCTSFRRTMGFDKQPPDEYTVVENAPLTMPPDFGLRPPASGSGRPIDTSVPDQAQNTVFSAGDTGGDATPAATPGLSPGESALLSQAGATNADPSIRDRVDQDNAADHGGSLINRILYWHHDGASDQTLDAAKESARIQSDVSAGKPINDGSAPAIQRTNRTIFDAL